MDILTNPYRNSGHVMAGLDAVPMPSEDATHVTQLLARCPVAAETPLSPAPALAKAAGVAEIWIKDERGRMGLGSFKALGAAYVVARDHAQGRSQGQTYVTASAGNHGLSLASGAAAFGAASRIYIAETVPESFAERLRAVGAEVRREGAIYEDSMAAAARDAEAEGMQLVSDSSWPGYIDRPYHVMEGYTAMMAEVDRQMSTPPSHIFLQAGVGGLAAAVAAYSRKIWGDGPVIVVVEPEAAPALIASVRAGKPVVSDGPVSVMGRLDCKEPSLIALKGLCRDADGFMTLTENEAMASTEQAAQAGIASTPSGAAGLAGLMHAAASGAFGVGAQTRALVILSETSEA